MQLPVRHLEWAFAAKSTFERFGIEMNCRWSTSKRRTAGYNKTRWKSSGYVWWMWWTDRTCHRNEAEYEQFDDREKQYEYFGSKECKQIYDNTHDLVEKIECDECGELVEKSQSVEQPAVVEGIQVKQRVRPDCRVNSPQLKRISTGEGDIGWANCFSHIEPETAENWLQSFACWHNAPN